MDIGVRDRVYVVSGAASGLGLASSAALVADGARVVLCSRSHERISAAAASLNAPDQVVAVAADLGEESTARLLVDTALERFERLDGAIISVGGPPPGPVSAVTDDAWRSSFETVFLGPLRLARDILAGGDDRAVTFVLSTSVKSPIAGLSISNGLRPGLAGAAKDLADEFGPRGSRVNVLMPGRIDTDRIRAIESTQADPQAAREAAQAGVPLRRYGRAEEFGAVAAFVTSPRASYLTGAAIPVDGGSLRTL